MQTPLVMEPTVVLEPPSTLLLFSPCSHAKPRYNHPKRETSVIPQQFHPYATNTKRNEVINKNLTTRIEPQTSYIIPQNTSNFILPKKNLYLKTPLTEEIKNSTQQGKFQIGHWTGTQLPPFI